MKKWIIYKHTNKINKKSYIGQTCCKSAEIRWGKNGKKYLLKNKKTNKYIQPKFARALLKYGWNNFEHSILENDILSNSEADKLEEYYIKKYNTIKQGYNILKGGHKTSGNNKVIYQLDESKNILKVFNSINEAALYLGDIKYNQAISKCCKNLRNNFKNYYWCYKDKYNSYKIQKKSKYKRFQILQLNYNYKIINEYECSKQAAKILNLQSSGIIACCLGKYKTCGGYKWCYKKDYQKVLNNQEKEKINRICQLDDNLKLIATYSSQKEIIKTFGKINISRCLNKKAHKTKNYYWCYESELKTFKPLKKEKKERVKFNRWIEQWSKDEKIFINRFNSIAEACRKTNTQESCLRRYLKGILKSAGGFTWKIISRN